MIGQAKRNHLALVGFHPETESLGFEEKIGKGLQGFSSWGENCGSVGVGAADLEKYGQRIRQKGIHGNRIGAMEQMGSGSSEGGPTTGFGFFIIFLPAGKTQTFFDLFLAFLGASGGDVSAPEFYMVDDAWWADGKGLLEVDYCLVKGGLGEASVDGFSEEAQGGVERGHFEVPTSEDVQGVVVIGIEAEGGFSFAFERFGEFDFFPGSLELSLASLANGEAESGFSTVGLGFDGTFGVGDRFAGEAEFFPAGGGVADELGELFGEELEEGGVVWAHFFRFPKDLECALVFIPFVVGTSVAKELVEGWLLRGKRPGCQEAKDEYQWDGFHLRKR
jgi:hypothetical protein